MFHIVSKSHFNYKLSKLRKKMKYESQKRKSKTKVNSHLCVLRQLSKFKKKKMSDKKNYRSGPKDSSTSNGFEQYASNQRSQNRNGKFWKKNWNWHQNSKSSNNWHTVGKKGSYYGTDVNNNEPMFEYSDHPNCICSRPSMSYECGRCHHYFHGRVAEICPMHTNHIFLMDFQRCPYCAAQTHVIQKSTLTWEQIRKFEDAELPGGDEGL